MNQQLAAWGSLLLAACFETAWLFSLKNIRFDRIKTLWKQGEMITATGGLAVLPVLGYVVFGLANVYFFSLAQRQIVSTTAFAVWTALSLLLIKLSDTVFFRQGWSWPELFFLLLIAVGIIGLKTYATP